MKNNELGNIAFLNGEAGLESCDERYFKHLRESGIQCELIDNLWEQPEKLANVRNFDTLVLHSTGHDAQRLDRLFDIFKSLEYTPKHVIFTINEDPFVSLAFKYKGKIKFYRYDPIDNEPYELGYLNK